ncbi:aldo/keto reductase [Bacteroidales bacterium OttesenSCG-928-K03]|nr:aldo/keto reductase [Bacteroidales bacterium OttesenSCG-928-L14]MDL2243045.1 aldo/keto reductase [Bacteroidales bacterium OttesenSCG-928-K03]
MRKNNKINRRKFLKVAGGGIATAAALTACNFKDKKTQEIIYDKTNEPLGEMAYRTNHNSGDKVSLLGYGCMRWPLTTNEIGEEIIDQEAVNKMIDYAIDHGVNYFDTAPRYIRGMSEKASGIALSRHPREKYFLATKMSNQSNDAYTRSREGSINIYRTSMKNLQTDYLDYYLLHSIGGGGMETFKSRFYDNGILDFLLEEREKGRIRNLGWSFHGDIEVFNHAISSGIKWDFAMIQLNYFDWGNPNGLNFDAEHLYNELTKHNIPVVIMEPLLGGRLARLGAHQLEILNQLRPDDSPANWAFRFAGSHDNVLTVLSGMTYMEHLQENVRTYSPFEPLSNEEKNALKQVSELMRNSDYIPCTECQYCMPCPYGIDIPSIFAHYNKCLTEGKIVRNTQDENYRKARREFLIGYDRSVPKLRQANQCIGCKECLAECPQKIKIHEEMFRIDEYVEKIKITGKI